MMDKGPPVTVEDWEDPARAWVDLVAAYHAHSVAGVKEMLGVAKKSAWTHAVLDKFDREFDEAETEAALVMAGYGDFDVETNSCQANRVFETLEEEEEQESEGHGQAQGVTVNRPPIFAPNGKCVECGETVDFCECF